MVDGWGFDIQHLLASKCATLNIPPFSFARKREVVTFEEEVEKRSVASVRIRVERGIELVKLSYRTRCYSNIFTCTVGGEIWFV